MDYETRLELYADTLHGFIKAEIEEGKYVTPTPESIQDFFDNLQDMVKDTIAMNLIRENSRKKVEAN